MKASVKSSGLQTIGLCGGHYAIINKENKMVEDLCVFGGNLG